jgi:hypothetical protein
MVGTTPASDFRSLTRLTLGELLQPGRFSGSLMSVRRYGPHRLLHLKEECVDGRALAVWVSSAALEAEESRSWAAMLDSAHALGSTVLFRGRFSHYAHAERLTADIHYPCDIWLQMK